jgi:hypothetical protein
MSPEELKDGFRELNTLAESEYHQSLQELMRDTTRHSDSSLRIARLVGVVLKEPFATPRDLDRPSWHSHAYRTWELLEERTIEEPPRRDSWQYQVLQSLAQETGTNVYQLALDAHHERGFFGYLGRSTAKYICGDAKIRKEITKAVNEAKKGGVNINATSPELLVGSAGLSLGVLLIQSVPVLGLVGAPVIAGLVLIVYRIGVNAFCEWVNDAKLNSPLERA